MRPAKSYKIVKEFGIVKIELLFCQGPHIITLGKPSGDKTRLQEIPVILIFFVNLMGAFACLIVLLQGRFKTKTEKIRLQKEKDVYENCAWL